MSNYNELLHGDAETVCSIIEVCALDPTEQQAALKNAFDQILILQSSVRSLQKQLSEVLK